MAWVSYVLCGICFIFCVVSGDFRKMVDVNFICAMGPPGGGRNPVTARLMRHFNYLTFTELEDPSKRKIFGAIFNGWIRKLPLSQFATN